MRDQKLTHIRLNPKDYAFNSSIELPRLDRPVHSGVRELYQECIQSNRVCEGDSFEALANGAEFLELVSLEIKRRKLFLDALTQLGKEHLGSFDATNAFTSRALFDSGRFYLQVHTVASIPDDVPSHLDIKSPYLACAHYFMGGEVKLDNSHLSDEHNPLLEYIGLNDPSKRYVICGSIMFDKQVTEALKMDSYLSPYPQTKQGIVYSLKRIMETTSHDYIHQITFQRGYSIDDFTYKSKGLSNLSNRFWEHVEFQDPTLEATPTDNERRASLVHSAVCEYLYRNNPKFREYVENLATTFVSDLEQFKLRILPIYGQEKATAIASTIAYFGLVHLNQVIDVKKLFNEQEANHHKLKNCCDDVEEMFKNVYASAVVQPPLITSADERERHQNQALRALVHHDSHLRLTISGYNQGVMPSVIPADMLPLENRHVANLYWKNRSLPNGKFSDEPTKNIVGRLLPIVGDPYEIVEEKEGNIAQEMIRNRITISEFRALTREKLALV